jgi:hypothetical protein
VNTFRIPLFKIGITKGLFRYILNIKTPEALFPGLFVLKKGLLLMHIYDDTNVI